MQSENNIRQAIATHPTIRSIARSVPISNAAILHRLGSAPRVLVLVKR